MENKKENLQTNEKMEEEDFNLKTCFEGKFLKGEGYEKDSDYYFDSYSHFGIHEEMLKDKVKK